MHYQCKYSGIIFADAVHHHHCYYGKVPRSGTVWGWYYYCNASYHEQYQADNRPQALAETETIEAQIELQVVAQPNQCRVEDEQPYILYPAQG